MNSIVQDIKDILLGVSSLAFVFGTDLFIAQEPPTPSNCVTIFDVPGAGTDLTMDRQFYYRDAFQIRVRNKNYIDGYALAKEIEECLNGLNNVPINNTYYAIIECTTNPVLLDFDENNRPRFIINFNSQRREV